MTFALPSVLALQVMVHMWGELLVPAWFWRQSLSMDSKLTVSARLVVQGATGILLSTLVAHNCVMLMEGKAWQSDRANWVDNQQG